MTFKEWWKKDIVPVASKCEQPTRGITKAIAEMAFEAATPKWTPITERMPEPGVPVIALVNPNEYGKKRRIRAQWAPSKTLEQDWDAEGGIYDEETDKYYCEEGWYETNEFEEVHWAVSGTVTHWQPLPAYPEE